MTKLASWIVTSHHRPRLLDATLRHLTESYVPPGWAYEVVVAYVDGDSECAKIAKWVGSPDVPSRHPNPGGKRNDALAKCRGELVLVTDDDDFQSPRRLARAIEAYEAGHLLSGIREFRRLHLATGNVVRYIGHGHLLPGVPDIPPVFCGTARNYARSLLERHIGWRTDLRVGEDSELHARITRDRDLPVVEYDFGRDFALDTIICQHDTNLCPRPEIAAGHGEMFGDYWVMGEGPMGRAVGFPPEVILRLGVAGYIY